MKGIINIHVNNEIEIYIKASNIQGTVESTFKKKDWNEILNKELNDHGCFSIKIKKYNYNINKEILKINMILHKHTGIYNFDLELKNIGNNTYSAKLGGPDLFTWYGIILNLTLTPFIMVYNKINK